MLDYTTPALLSALHGVLSQVSEPTEVLRLILDQAVGLTGAERGLFAEVNSEGSLEYQVLHQIRRADLTGPGGRFSRTIFAEVRKTRSALRLEDARLNPAFSATESVRGLQLVAVLCVPLFENGEIVALLHLEGNRPGQFSAEHEALAHSLLEMAEPVYRAFRAGRQVLAERDHLRVEVTETRRALAEKWTFARFVGQSPRLHDLQQGLLKAALRDFPILLLGESGTGKSLLARAIHSASPRAQKPFVTVFCPSLQPQMFEADLFGHQRGGFTGAQSDRAGKVQAAEGGTLFLDEIGELSLDTQSKMLRLLQERTYERVGDATERKANVRMVVATNRDLEQEVMAGRFRRDLFERLNFIPLEIPPLRERREDIPRLLRHCLDQLEDGRWMEVTPEAEALIRSERFSWPGNVRAVEQLAARLSLEAVSPVTPEVVERALRGQKSAATSNSGGDARVLRPSATDPALADLNLEVRLRQAEKRCLEEAMERYPRATRAELAAVLGIKPSTLYVKLKLHGLSAPETPND